MSEAQRKTTSRRELARNPRFEQVSPEVGEMDQAAVDEGMRDDPDEVLGMLADLTAATDPKLREMARRLAGRLFLELSRRGPTRPRGIGKMAEQQYRPDAGDLDVDASLDAIAEAGGLRSGRSDRSRAAPHPWLGEARHRAVPARRPQRIDGRQAARRLGGRRRGRRMARADRLQRARVRQGRGRREEPGRGQVGRARS